MANNDRPYKIVKGEKIYLTSKEVKQYIMSVNKWTEDEYKKERYKLKNRLRTFEAYTGVAPDKVQSPTKILYFEAKMKKRLGDLYEPSFQMERLKGFAAYGSSRAIDKALANPKIEARISDYYSATTKERFEGLMKAHPKAKEIWEKIDDPVKREQALSDYADFLHEKVKQRKEANKNEAIPIEYGETFGYGEPDDFNYAVYLT